MSTKTDDLQSRPRPEEADIRFETAKDYKLIYANGVYGGVTPRGDLAMDVITEFSSRPSKQTFKVEDDGTLGDLVAQEGSEEIVRQRLATLFLQPNNARSIAEWMLSKLFQVSQTSIHKTLEEEFLK